jgi:pSer/pThr/pTyr-binding forkhead associated (FHA) protein
MIPEMTMRIMVMSGPDDGLEITLTNTGNGTSLDDDVLGQFSIGRRDNSDICVPFDTLVSRLHATLYLRHDGLWLVDENSRNGTFVGRRRVKEPEKLSVGQMFRVGGTWLRVQSVDDDSKG